MTLVMNSKRNKSILVWPAIFGLASFLSHQCSDFKFDMFLYCCCLFFQLPLGIRFSWDKLKQKDMVTMLKKPNRWSRTVIGSCHHGIIFSHSLLMILCKDDVGGSWYSLVTRCYAPPCALWLHFGN